MTLHPQALAALELWNEGPKVTDADFGPEVMAAMRRDARVAASAEPKESVARVEDLDIDGVRCRLYVPTDAASHGVLVFLHGGGFVFGDIDTHDGQSRRLANRSGLAVLAVDYRCAPEHPFPAAPDDVDTALRWVLDDRCAAHGLDSTRVAVIGDSAGGNLALVAALRNPDELAAIVLVYPFVDPTLSGASYATETGGLTRGDGEWYWQQYAATEADRSHPHLAPLLADLRYLPPTLVQIAGEDALADEDRELVRLLEKAGVDVESTTYDGMIHGFWRHPQLFDAAEETFAEMADFVRRYV